MNKKQPINYVTGMHEGSLSSAISKESVRMDVKTWANHRNLLNYDLHKEPQESLNRSAVVDNFDCKSCSLSEECYGSKIDALFTRYPTAVAVLAEQDITGLSLENPTQGGMQLRSIDQSHPRDVEILETDNSHRYPHQEISDFLDENLDENPAPNKVTTAELANASGDTQDIKNNCASQQLVTRHLSILRRITNKLNDEAQVISALATQALQECRGRESVVSKAFQDETKSSRTPVDHLKLFLEEQCILAPEGSDGTSDFTKVMDKISLLQSEFNIK